MRYGIVVKDVTHKMMENLLGVHYYGMAGRIKPIRNSLFRINRVVKYSKKDHRYDHTGRCPYLIPTKWCLQLTREEYLIFKQLEK